MQSLVSFVFSDDGCRFCLNESNLLFFIIKRNIISYYGISSYGTFTPCRTMAVLFSVLSWVAHGTHSITPFPFCVSYFIDRPSFLPVKQPRNVCGADSLNLVAFFSTPIVIGLVLLGSCSTSKKGPEHFLPCLPKRKKEVFFLLLYLYYFFKVSGPFSIWSVSSFFLSFFFFFFICSFWAVADLWYLLRIVFLSLSFSLPFLGGGILWQEPDEFFFASFHHKDIGSWAPCAWLGIRLYV